MFNLNALVSSFIVRDEIYLPESTLSTPANSTTSIIIAGTVAAIALFIAVYFIIKSKKK